MLKALEKIKERLEEELKLADGVKEKCARENPLMFDNAKGYSTGISNALHIVNQVAKEVAADVNVGCNGWIPCSKELPKVYEDTKSSDVVLVCGYDKKRDYSWQAMGFYVHTEGIKRWFFAECKDTDKPIDWIDIVAWQPLPDPYKERICKK